MRRKLYSAMTEWELIERYVFGFEDQAGELEAELRGRELFGVAHKIYENAVENARKQVEKGCET